jgi:hypothetical protein
MNWGAYIRVIQLARCNLAARRKCDVSFPIPDHKPERKTRDSGFNAFKYWTTFWEGDSFIGNISPLPRKLIIATRAVMHRALNYTGEEYSMQNYEH